MDKILQLGLKTRNDSVVESYGWQLEDHRRIHFTLASLALLANSTTRLQTTMI